MRAVILCLLLAGCGDGGALLEPIEKPTHDAAPVPTKPE